MKKIVRLSEQSLINLIKKVLNEVEAPSAETRCETNMERLARQNPETTEYLKALQTAQQQQGSNYSKWLQSGAQPCQVVKQGGGYSYDSPQVPMDSRKPAAPARPVNEVESIENQDPLSSLNLPEDVINMAACYQDPIGVVDSLDNPELMQKAVSDKNLSTVLNSLEGKSTQELVSEFKKIKSLMGNVKEQAAALATVTVFGVPVLTIFLGLILLGIVVSLFKRRRGSGGYAGGGRNACKRKKSIHNYWRQQGSGFGL